MRSLIVSFMALTGVLFSSSVMGLVGDVYSPPGLLGISDSKESYEKLEVPTNGKSDPRFFSAQIFEKNTEFVVDGRKVNFGNLSSITYVGSEDLFYGIIDRALDEITPSIVAFQITPVSNGKKNELQVHVAKVLDLKANGQRMALDAEALLVLEDGRFLVAIEGDLKQEVNKLQTGVLFFSKEGEFISEIPLPEDYKKFVKVIEPGWAQPLLPELPKLPEEPKYPSYPTLLTLPPMPKILGQSLERYSYWQGVKYFFACNVLKSNEYCPVPHNEYKTFSDFKRKQRQEFYIKRQKEKSKWERENAPLIAKNEALISQYRMVNSALKSWYKLENERVTTEREKIKTEYRNLLQKWESEVQRIPYGQSDDNEGIESLALIDAGSILVAGETPLRQDNHLHRLSTINTLNGEATHYFYQSDQSKNSISDVLPFDNDNWLILEKYYDSKQRRVIAKIYLVNRQSQNLIADGRVVLNKTLFVDLNDFDSYLTSDDLYLKDMTLNRIDNLEGMTFGGLLPNGNLSLIVVSDSNRQLSTDQVTQFIALDFNKLLDHYTKSGKE